MAVSVNWGPFCGCPQNQSPTIWSVYQDPPPVAIRRYKGTLELINVEGWYWKV